MNPLTLDTEYSYPLHQSGHVSTLPAEEECEAVRLLREAVKEVTGQDVQPPPKPRMGFLP